MSKAELGFGHAPNFEEILPPLRGKIKQEAKTHISSMSGPAPTPGPTCPPPPRRKEPPSAGGPTGGSGAEVPPWGSPAPPEEESVEPSVTARFAESVTAMLGKVSTAFCIALPVVAAKSG